MQSNESEEVQSWESIKCECFADPGEARGSSSRLHARAPWTAYRHRVRFAALTIAALAACTGARVAAPPAAPTAGGAPLAPASTADAAGPPPASTEGVVEGRPPPRGRIVTVDEVWAAHAGAQPNGTADPTALKQVIRDRFHLFRACYERELKHTPTLVHVTVRITFLISTDGTVELAAVVDPDPRVPTSMRNCIATEYLYLQFPAPVGGPVIVTYPITFAVD